MKKILFVILGCGLIINNMMAELNLKQMQLRKDIFAALSAKHYNPKLDRDGDIDFQKDDLHYWVNINENWNDPYMVTIFTLMGYEPEKDITQQNVSACASIVNQMKTVKVLSQDGRYLLRSDIICNNAETVTQAIDDILEEQDKANRYIAETITSGLGGVDMTGDREEVFLRALVLYYDGHASQAVKLFSYLADSDYPLAYSMLGEAYEDGKGVPKNEEKMIANYEKGVEKGVYVCAYSLGNYYYNKKNYKKALKWYQQAAENDNYYRSQAYYMVGHINEEGLGIPENNTIAIKNYKKAVEYAKDIDCDGRRALVRLGQRIESPEEFVDIPKSLLSGLSSKDMYDKGCDFEHGQNNRPVSLPKAYGYYKAAADRDNPWALIKLGYIYVSDYYPFGDREKSNKCFAKAFKILKKDENTDAYSCYLLGRFYKEGLSVTPDKDQGMAYFRKAASMGNDEANYQLGLIYQEEKEDADAFEYFKKAADKSNADAMLAVAKAYQTGKGTPRSMSKAIEWYNKCAESDNAEVAKQAKEALRKIDSSEDEKQ